MTRLQYARSALDDLDRISDFLMEHDAENAFERQEELLAAIRVLTYAPEIGRPAGAGTRELIVGRKARGYVVRYRYLPRVDVAIVITLRHQRELPNRR